jgi:hypothetical protein
MLHHRRAINYNNNHKGDLVDLMTAVLISLVILFLLLYFRDYGSKIEKDNPSLLKIIITGI